MLHNVISGCLKRLFALLVIAGLTRNPLKEVFSGIFDFFKINIFALVAREYFLGR